MVWWAETEKPCEIRESRKNKIVMKKKFIFSLNKETVVDLTNTDKKTIVGGQTQACGPQNQNTDSDCMAPPHNWIIPTTTMAGCVNNNVTRFGCCTANVTGCITEGIC